MRLIALKPCSFGGRKYFKGEEIPSKEVINPAVQESQGTLAIVKDEQGMMLETAETGKVTIPVIRDGEGDVADVLSVHLTERDVQHVFTIMQMTADKAAEAIEKVNTEEILIVLHATDNRSGVKKAAQKRAEQLSSIETDKNESVGGNETTEGNTKPST